MFIGLPLLNLGLALISTVLFHSLASVLHMAFTASVLLQGCWSLAQCSWDLSASRWKALPSPMESYLSLVLFLGIT